MSFTLGFLANNCSDVAGARGCCFNDIHWDRNLGILVHSPCYPCIRKNDVVVLHCNIIIWISNTRNKKYYLLSTYINQVEMSNS